jgi:hypothetical protein
MSDVGRGNGGASCGLSAAATSSANRPDMIGPAKRHRGRTKQRFVDAAEIVERNPKRDRGTMVFQFLRESVG